MLYFSVNLFFILSVASAVPDGIEHKEPANHKAGDDAGQKQITYRSSGSRSVHDKGNAWWNDDSKTSGNGNDGCSKSKIIAEPGQDRNRHTSDGSNGSRSRSGDRAVKQTGDDDGARHSCRQFAEKVCEYIKEFPGNTSLCHDDTGQNEHRNGQKGKRIQTSEHCTD